ncbi:MAG: hypothetical protein Q9207_000243 [Kuettlingeria erythrocarpa]
MVAAQILPELEGDSAKNMGSKDLHHVPVHVPVHVLQPLVRLAETPYIIEHQPGLRIKTNNDGSQAPCFFALLFAVDKKSLAMFFVASLLTAWAVVLNCMTGLVVAAPNHCLPSSYITYTSVAGYFLQDDASTNASIFSFLDTHFGLINRTYPTDAGYDPRGKKTQWQRFANQVFKLNRDAPRGTQYKLLYMGRHGEGYHNAAESYYGTPAWNCYYSLIDGNETVAWADARITPKGVAQALTVHAFWASEIKNQKIPTPQSYYTSPLTRCLETANLTFGGLKLPSRHPFVATVKEFFREGISGHTCDRRGTRSYIQSAFPSYKIEPGFSETDQLWQAYHAETQLDQDIRSKMALDDVFTGDRETYLSITSHSGEIASLLRGEEA